MKLKHIGIPAAFFVMYAAMAVLSYQFVNDAVLCSLMADLVMLAVGGIYYRKCVGDAALSMQPVAIPLTAASLVAVWFISSLTVTWLTLVLPDMFQSPYATVDGDSALYLLVTLIVAPMTEEVLFRGILFRHAKQVTNIVAAYLVTNVIFALFHGTMLHLYGALVSGIFFTMVYEYTGTISASVSAHAGYNLMVILLSRIGVPDVFFSTWVIIPLNILLVTGFIVAGCYIESTMAERKGVPRQKPSRWNLGGRFMKSPASVTAGMIAQMMMPGCILMVWDQSGTQLFNGTAETLCENPSIGGRRVAVEQSFVVNSGLGVEGVTYLVIKVL